MKTITVKDETHAELTRIGKKGESYDDVIQRLIHDYKVYVVD
jgi:predicted CopG family antitoxin